MKLSKEQIELIQNLIDVGSDKIGHNHDGMCPDDREGYGKRDRKCPACKILIQAGKEIKKSRE